LARLEMSSDPRTRFLASLENAVTSGAFVKLTLGKSRSSDPTLKNLFVRRVELKSGPHLSFLWRHATRDITKNHPIPEGLANISSLIGREFLDAHLFTRTENAQLECQPDGTAKLRVKAAHEPERAAAAGQPSSRHDRPKSRLIPGNASWLRALGVTNDRGLPREGMSDKFRQIEKFAELLTHLLGEAFTLPEASSQEEEPQVPPLRIVDMGSGKGYLTFAIATLLGPRATVLGVEARKELADFCNRVAGDENLVPALRFSAGTIAETTLSSIALLIGVDPYDTAT